MKMKVQDILTKVKANRASHRNEFLEAQEGYRKKAIEILDQRLADARAGKELNMLIQLPAPQDHTKDYDRVIMMLEMTTDEVLEIDQNEFAQYVLDDWSWKQQFMLTNSMYK
jgi:hypothetical protein